MVHGCYAPILRDKTCSPSTPFLHQYIAEGKKTAKDIVRQSDKLI